MNKSLGEIDINPRIAAAAKRAGLTTAGSVITLSGPELSHLTGLNSGDAKQLADAVAEVVLFGPPTTALEILRGGSSSDYFMLKLSTGCRTLDQHLRGGVLTRVITEVAGESAAGKTQFCLQLCLTVQLPLKEGGLGSGAVYVCTEDTFPSKRFQQLDGLNSFVQKKLPLLLARKSVQLVVIDSVAALFRCHYESHNLVARAKHLASLATQLRKLAVQYNVAVVCVNQVTANMSNTSDRDGNTRHSIPALGMAWADHVTCRLQMSRPQESLVKVFIKDEDSTQKRKNAETSKTIKTVRQLEVVFAPHLPHVVIPLIITASGISCLR